MLDRALKDPRKSVENRAAWELEGKILPPLVGGMSAKLAKGVLRPTSNRIKGRLLPLKRGKNLCSRQRIPDLSAVKKALKGFF